MTTSTPFVFPREYHFPAFFTRQPNLTTRHAQLNKWSSLILSYARHHSLFRLHLSGDSSAATAELFHNARIDRRLQPADIRDVIDFMRKEGRAESVDGGGDVVLLWWRKPEEWASLVEKWVDDTAQKGTVLTLYELTDGEGTRGTDIHGMDKDVLLKCLKICVRRNKAQIFGSEDSPGIKFF